MIIEESLDAQSNRGRHPFAALAMLLRCPVLTKSGISARDATKLPGTATLSPQHDAQHSGSGTGPALDLPDPGSPSDLRFLGQLDFDAAEQAVDAQAEPPAKKPLRSSLLFSSTARPHTRTARKFMAIAKQSETHFTGMLSGILPAARRSRRPRMSALRQQARGSSIGSVARRENVRSPSMTQPPRCAAGH